MISDNFYGDKIIKIEKKINQIKEKDKREVELKDFYKRNKEHPIINYNMSVFFLSKANYSKGFDCIQNYETVRDLWSKKNSINFSLKEFIPIQQVIGSLGNYFPLFYYLIYKKNIDKSDEKPTLLIKNGEKITNPFLYNFFKPYLNIIESTSKFYKFRYFNQIFKVPLEIVLPFKKKHYPWPIAINFINQSMNKIKNSDFKFFKLSENDLKKGRLILNKIGIPENAWYVTLHIRQGLQSQGHDHRNSNPLTYLKAIKEITSRGGYVFRMGDKSMTQLPQIKGLIDYPFSEYKSEFMDVFLGATCKFCVGTSSGYYSIPIYFGKPVVLVNFLNVMEYYSLKSNDIFLPKNLLDKITKKPISIKRIFNSPIGYYGTDEEYKKNNIEILDNNDEEIKCAVLEMLDNLDGNKINQEFLNKNKKVREELDSINNKNYEFPLRAMAHLPLNFLNKYYS